MRGRDLITGLPKEIEINDGQVRESILRSLRSISHAIKVTLESTPPELVADIYERGVVLIGGGALLKGIDQLISAHAEVPVRIADDPLTCVARGTGILLENKDLLAQVALPSTANTPISFDS